MSVISLSRNASIVYEGLNQIIIPEDFEKTLQQLNQLKVRDLSDVTFSPSHFEKYDKSGKLVLVDDVIKAYDMDLKNGEKCAQNNVICAYDESIRKYQCLQGSVYYSSHAATIMAPEQPFYLPVTKLSLGFYTRSSSISEEFELDLSEDAETDFTKKMVAEKIEFLNDSRLVPNNSILLIDGPLIAGDWYVLMIRAIKKFLERGVIPLFFVKNSDSSLVTDNYSEFKGLYNSDLHWCHDFLEPGQRTSLFRYTDEHNQDNTKIFCYFKSMNCSPQRLEMHVPTYENFGLQIEDCINMVHYLVTAQGDRINPQIRPIAISEKYARETLRVFNIKQKLKGTPLEPIMNEVRFGG